MEKVIVIKKNDKKTMVDFYNDFDIKRKRCNIKKVMLNNLEIEVKDSNITRTGVESLLKHFKITPDNCFIEHDYMFDSVQYGPIRYANRLFFFNSFEALINKAETLEGISLKKLNQIRKNYSVVSVVGNDFYYYIGDTADLFSLFVGSINKFGTMDDNITVIYDYISVKGMKNNSKNQISDFKEWFNLNRDEQLKIATETNLKNEELRKEFLEEWPFERLKTMNVNDYVIGFGSESKSLCYELEHGKYADLYLSIRGGSAGKFGMYWSSNDDAYKDQSNKLIPDSEVARRFEILRTDLTEIIEESLELNFEFESFNTNSFSNRIGMVTKLLCIYGEDLYFGANVSQKETKLWTVLGDKSFKGNYYKLNHSILMSISDEYLDIEKELLGIILWNYRETFNNDKKDEEDLIVNLNKTVLKHKEKLLTSKNIILRGAPGTGKTYLARQIATSIISKGTKINYDSLNEDELNQFEFVQFHPSYDYTDFVEGLRPRLSKDSSMVFILEDGIFKKFVNRAKENPTQNYVFIIDEINRGEISKIFGELFYSIDPGYRGISGSVSTQFSNMSESIDEKFYVPENVYIIGTMNDIDRSVDSFDFAMRRRFRFIEIKASENTEMLSILGTKESEATIRMNRLNDAISNIDGLNNNYHIGPSYFLHLESGISYEELWRDYLEPLVHDYIRGMYDEEELLSELKNAYQSDLIN